MKLPPQGAAIPYIGSPERLTPSEHSRLIYLTDSLMAAPGKVDKLIELAWRGSGSEPYKRALGRLRDAQDLPSEIGRLRAELR